MLINCHNNLKSNNLIGRFSCPELLKYLHLNILMLSAKFYYTEFLNRQNHCIVKSRRDSSSHLQRLKQGLQTFHSKDQILQQFPFVGHSLKTSITGTCGIVKVKNI